MIELKYKLISNMVWIHLWFECTLLISIRLSNLVKMNQHLAGTFAEINILT